MTGFGSALNLETLVAAAERQETLVDCVFICFLGSPRFVTVLVCTYF